MANNLRCLLNQTVAYDSYTYLTTDVLSVVSQVSAPSLLARRPNQHVLSLFSILKLANHQRERFLWIIKHASKR